MSAMTVEQILSELPVAVIGAGPVGLAAAAHLVARGQVPLILEAGTEVGSNIRKWSHVRLFSPWKYLVDPVCRELLKATGWTHPDPERLPTGAELVERFLEPLASSPTLAPHLRLGRRVLAVSRRGVDKVKSAERERAPFELLVQGPGGDRERILARAVIDASGTYGQPSPLGASGLPVEGEEEAREHILYGIPDVRGRDRERYAGRRTLVIGAGHSAFNAVLDLAALAREVQGTEVVWAVRRRDVGHLFGGGSKDALPARERLGTRLRELVDANEVRLVTGFRTERLLREEEGIRVESEGQSIGPVDEIVAATGYRPDVGMLRELRLELDPALESPIRLAPLIDPNVHSCGTVYPHGYRELGHPEEKFFVVGMKSYGRAPTFLLLTGYEQVRSVVAALSGDLEAARAVELVLPETGVCSTDLGGSSCCEGAGEERKEESANCETAPYRASELPVLSGVAQDERDGCCA